VPRGRCVGIQGLKWRYREVRVLRAACVISGVIGVAGLFAMCRLATMTRNDDFRVRPGGIRSKRERVMTVSDGSPNGHGSNPNQISPCWATPISIHRRRPHHTLHAAPAASTAHRAIISAAGRAHSLAAQPQRFDSSSTMLPRTTRVQKSCSAPARNAHPPPATLQADGLFVAGPPERQFRGMADVFVDLTVRRPIDQRTAR
jgi:hypothetical protein